MKHQLGVSTLPALYTIIIFGFILAGITNQLRERNEQIDADGVTASMIELAKAQARHIADPDNPNFGTYAADPATLVERGYLPNWRNDPDYTFTFPTNGVQINYNAATTALAAEIAVRFGSLSTLAGSIVTVGFADPVDLALFDVYVEKTGGTMTGTLEFEAGSGADIDMNQNDIVDAASVVATNPGSTGLMTTNVLTADTAIVQDLRIAE